MVEMACFSFKGEVGGVERSEAAKLDVDMERILILQALALSLPEYSESGDKGELPPLPGPPRVAELARPQLFLSRAYFLRSSSSYTFMSNMSLGGDNGDIAAPPPLNKDPRLKGLEGFLGFNSVIFPMPPRPETRGLFALISLLRFSTCLSYSIFAASC